MALRSDSPDKRSPINCPARIERGVLVGCRLDLSSGNHGKQLQIVKFKIIRNSDFQVFPVISTVKIRLTSKSAYE
jgi:hypothetical protein